MIFDSTKLTKFTAGERGEHSGEASKEAEQENWMKSKSIGAFQIDTDLEQGLHDFRFPSALKLVDEILALCSLSYGNYTIFILWPKKGKIFVSPQHWYNKLIWDYDYQWITRIVRDPKTERIVGHGVRMGLFLLNQTATEFLGWIQKDEYVKSLPRE